MKKFNQKILLSVIFSLLLTYILTRIYSAPYRQNVYLSKSQDGIQLAEFIGPVLEGRPVPTGGYFEDGYIRIWADDGIYLRYIRWLKTKDNHFVTGLAVAKSKDGVHFQREKMTLDTFPNRLALLTDPVLIKTKEGMWRLYVAVWEWEGLKVARKPLYSLISRDGINWQCEGKATDYTCGDPTVLFIEEKNYYVLYCPSGRNSRIAISPDGRRFPELKDSPFMAIQGAIKAKDGYLLYYDKQPGIDMRRNGVALSRDGITIEKDFDLNFPLNEPAIIVYSDGLYYFYSAFPSDLEDNLNRESDTDL